jgi:hypothetical protein
VSERTILDSIFAKAASLQASRTTRKFMSELGSAIRCQQSLLSRLIRRGALTQFGRDHRLDAAQTYEQFRTRVPICTYEELSPYVQQVRAGRVEALLPPGERVLMFALTSGTTAQPKYIPITPSVLAECRRGWNIWGLKAIMDHPRSLLRHILQVTSSMQDHTAPSGVPCGAITGLLAATQKRLVRKYYTSPANVAGISDSTAKYYTIMRLAMPRDVAWAVTANPSTLILLAKTADAHKERLIRDIHAGTLWDELPVSSEIRSALRPRLAPQPDAARRLERLASASGSLYPKDYWRLDFLAHWTGGTMGLYRSQIPRYFGDVPVRDIGLIASEGRMSIPLTDESASGVLAITSHFYEFIPAEEYGNASPTVLRMHELQEGREYFLLLTNASGLFRYDIGDRVRVTGWQGQAPMIEFLSRDAHTSSLTGEKLTEHQVVLAMQSVCGKMTDRVVEFVVSPRWGEPPRYRLYVEQGMARQHAGLAERLDQALCGVNGEYASKRSTLRLGQVEMCPLPAGTLTRRDEVLRRSRSRTSEQFKHQYLLAAPGQDGELAECAQNSSAASESLEQA